MEDFAAKYGMQDSLAVLRKGALLAQSPRDFEEIKDLDDVDKEIIRRETTRT